MSKTLYIICAKLILLQSSLYLGFARALPVRNTFLYGAGKGSSLLRSISVGN